MQWMIAGQGWPVGQFLIPAGRILTGVAGPSDGLIAAGPPGTHVSQTVGMPLDCIAIDYEGAIMMYVWYQPPKDYWYRLIFGPGIDRATVESRARATGLIYNW
jgi:hypothetical protein